MWLLFPLGMGVNRLLKRSGDIPASWRARLDTLLGTDDWYDAFFSVTMTRDLFGDDLMQVQKASMDTIGQYFLERLRSVFAGVADRPGVLMNSKGNSLYLLCFAVGNERACGPALRIANHLLEGMR